MEEKIQSIRYHGDKVTVEWDEPNGRSREQCKLECEDAPRQSFIDAFDALTPHALELVEIGDESWKLLAKVIKVNIKRDGAGTRSVILTVHRSLEHGSVTVNTPLRREITDESQAGASFASEKLIDAVVELMREAMAYVRGQREQGDLFAEKESRTAGETDDEADEAEAEAEAEAETETVGA